jgi:hypothetical protein
MNLSGKFRTSQKENQDLKKILTLRKSTYFGMWPTNIRLETARHVENI